MATPTANAPVLYWKTQRAALDNLNRMAAAELLSIFNAAKAMPVEDGRKYLVDAIMALIDNYGGTASLLAADWVETLYDDPSFQAGLASPPSLSTITRKVAWGTAPNQSGNPYTRLVSIVQQGIFGMHRDTVLLGAAETGMKWARYASPDCCAFCRVLASRGAVYTSKAAAVYVGASGWKKHYSASNERGRRFKKGRVRGVQKMGTKFHDHCRCIVAPSIDGVDDEKDGYMAMFEEQYLAATKEIKGGALDMKDVTRIMRSNGYGK